MTVHVNSVVDLPLMLFCALVPQEGVLVSRHNYVPKYPLLTVSLHLRHSSYMFQSFSGLGMKPHRTCMYQYVGGWVGRVGGGTGGMINSHTFATARAVNVLGVTHVRPARQRRRAVKPCKRMFLGHPINIVSCIMLPVR